MKKGQLNYYKIALDSSYFVKDSLGIPYDLDITTFSASLIDLTNPKAKNWYENLIEENMLSLGVHGWMADFGEWYPIRTNSENTINEIKKHNEYPVLWAKLNYEIIKENLDKEHKTKAINKLSNKLDNIEEKADEVYEKVKKKKKDKKKKKKKDMKRD